MVKPYLVVVQDMTNAVRAVTGKVLCAINPFAFPPPFCASNFQQFSYFGRANSGTMDF
jgi:hypothetical protein